MLLVFVLLLGLSLCFKLFMVLSVTVPKIDLIILASNTSSESVLLIPLIFFVSLDHLMSEIDFGLPSLIQQVVHIGFKVVLPV